MNKAALLAAAAAIALLAGEGFGSTTHGPAASSATHRSRGTKVLYNQNSNPTGVAIVSQNFSRTDSQYDCAAADDFVVPSGYVWKIGEIDVTGLYFTGSGTGTDNVTFYRDNRGIPGKIVKFLPYQTSTDDNGSHSIVLSRKVRLTGGGYWVSVVSNGPYWAAWGWETTAAIHGNQAMWENPGGGYGVCPTWGTIGSCLGTTGDLMFELKGEDKSRGT